MSKKKKKKKKERKKGVQWLYTDPNNSNSRDFQPYIFIKKLINSALNCEAYPYFDGVSSDHRIISANIHHILHSNKKQDAYTDISNHYTINVRESFLTLQETSERHNLNGKYVNFVTLHIEATVDKTLKYQLLTIQFSDY